MSPIGKTAPFVALLAGVGLVPALACASTYTFNVNYDVSTETCIALDSICTESFANTAYPGLVLNSGDVVNVDVTFSAPFAVPGATGFSGLLAYVEDANATTAAGTPVFSTNLPAVVSGYSGPAGLGLGAGQTGVNEGYYSAFVITGANSPFSLTGVDFTLDIDKGDPQPITDLMVYSASVAAPVPLPPSVWMMLSGIGGLAWLVRRRVAA